MADDLLARADQCDWLDVTVGYDADVQYAATREAGFSVSTDSVMSTMGTPAFLSEGLIQGLPALVSTATPATDAELAGCLTYKASDRADLVRQMTRMMTDQGLYAGLIRNLPLDAVQHYDRSQSWGSSFAKLLAKVHGLDQYFA